MFLLKTILRNKNQRRNTVLTGALIRWWIYYCDTVGCFPSMWLFFFLVIQDSDQYCHVADSLSAGLCSLWDKCISSQASQSPWRCATWGACQILLCTKTLHQSHYTAEVSLFVKCCGINNVQEWWTYMQISVHANTTPLVHRYGKRDIPDSVFTDVLMKESTETLPESDYAR